MKTSGRKFPKNTTAINASVTGSASQRRTNSDYVFGKSEIIFIGESFGLWLSSCTAIFNADSGFLSFRINCNLLGVGQGKYGRQTHYIGSYEKLTKEEFEKLYADLTSMSDDELSQYALDTFGKL